MDAPEFRVGPTRIFAPVVAETRAWGLRGFSGGPIGYVEIQPSDQCPILAQEGEPMPALEEVTLTFLRERIRFDADVSAGPSTAILEAFRDGQHDLGSAVNVKVESEPGEFVPGLDYRFYGHWVKHPKYGLQLVAKTFVRTQPHSRAGTIRYLQQAPHIGNAIAQRLWERFGGDAVRIVREQPDVAAAAVGRHFGLERAQEAAGYLVQEARTEAVTIDLMELFGGRGFPRDLGKRIVGEWGNRAAEIVRRSPYILMKFRGCGFLRCDQLFLDLGGDQNRIKRQALCAWYSIARNTDGHTWHAPSTIERGLRERISGTAIRPVDAVRLAKRAKLLAVRQVDGETWIAEAAKAEHEKVVAARVRAWFKQAASWPTIAPGEISQHQLERLTEATAAPVAILTGGPGTGKTYVAGKLISAIVQKAGYGQVAVHAPTGKAAVRISEVMAAYGLKIRATTTHSLLGVESHSEGEGWGFEHNEANPLPYQFVVGDEESMRDCDMSANLFRACAPNTHVLLVGDVGQLPPVGHGAPLRDLIAAGVPTGELTEIRRNSGQIVQACHAIRAGKHFQVCQELRPAEGENLKLLPAISGGAAVAQIVRTIRAIGARRLYDPIWQVQVIVAVNAKSELSRREINRRLQAELNPGGEKAGSNPFRVGDKIVCLKNKFHPIVKDAPSPFNLDATDGQVLVANGEQAAVKRVQEKLTIAQLDAPARMIKIPRGEGNGEEAEDDDASNTGCQWDLAYAVSCHKSQGSEWPVVLVVLDEYPGARLVCSREWLYTGMSRAKQVCFLVGKLATAYAMIEREAIRQRKTFLRKLIQEREE